VAIVITKNHKPLDKQPVKQPFEGMYLEDFLQKYIADSPEIIPLQEIRGKRWRIVAKGKMGTTTIFGPHRREELRDGDSFRQ
jgi:hypothetical protein